MIEAKDLTPLQLLALAKLISEKELEKFRDQVPAGSYAIDQVVHLRGNLSVAPPVFVNTPASLCPWSLVMILLERLRETSVEQIVEEAIARQKNGTKLDTEALKARTKAAVEKLLKSTRTERRGQVQFEGLVKQVKGATKRKATREPVNLFGDASARKVSS